MIKVGMGNNKYSAFEAATQFYNLFFTSEKHISIIDYLDNSFCDEIGEINTETWTYKFTYHVSNKYANPVIEGDYKAFFNYILENVVHPDDREIYIQTSAPGNQIKILNESKYPHFAFAHLRFKLKEGVYRWAELASIMGEEYGIPPNIVKFYIFDIHNAKLRELGDTSDEDGLYLEIRDEKTGLLKEEAFYKQAESLIKHKDVDWCVLSGDIEHFKLFDEWYGRNTGDFLLAKIGSFLNDYCKNVSGVAGYFGQDDFALLIPFDQNQIEYIFDTIRQAIISFGQSLGFMPAFGVCQLEHAKSIKDAYDKALIAQENAQHDIQKRIQYYDPKKYRDVDEELKILADFMQALKNDEITFYIQPQCRISTRQIVGGEALARWIKADGTIISPGIFVPILEKYSFITDLDKYIWDKVCHTLRSWIDRGLTPVPISINVSQVDIFRIDIAKHLKELVDKYNLDPSLLKIEITESTYAEKTSVVKELVDTLREMGFIILMDDFGSGYSSLNMLRDLKVDVVKLDALFLNISDENYEKGIHILESVVNMTKTISLPIVVEGVETQKQTDFLVDLGCRYVQGFYFYKPMPIEKFEKIIKNESNIDSRGFICKTNDQIKIREFLDENIYSDTMLNNVLGPVAFYAQNGEQVDITRFNQQFYTAVGASDFSQRLTHIERFVPDEDKPRFYAMFKNAIDNRALGAHEFVRFDRIDGTLMTFFLRVYYLGEKDGYNRFYGSAQDLTEFTNLRERMNLIAKYSSETIIFLKKKNGVFSFVVAAHGLVRETGISLEQLDKELNSRTIVKKRFSRGNHIDLKDLFEKSYEKNLPFSMPINLKRDDGEFVKIHMRADPVSDQANNVEYIFTFRLLNE